MAHILIVEDEKELAELVRDHLVAAGYSVAAAGEGATALRLLETRPADLVILDWMLPGLDGLEVCRRIRRAARHGRVQEQTASGTSERHGPTSAAGTSCAGTSWADPHSGRPPGAQVKGTRRTRTPCPSGRVKSRIAGLG